MKFQCTQTHMLIILSGRRSQPLNLTIFYKLRKHIDWISRPVFIFLFHFSSIKFKQKINRINKKNSNNRTVTGFVHSDVLQNSVFIFIYQVTHQKKEKKTIGLCWSREMNSSRVCLDNNNSMKKKKPSSVCPFFLLFCLLYSVQTLSNLTTHISSCTIQVIIICVWNYFVSIMFKDTHSLSLSKFGHSSRWRIALKIRCRSLNS